MRKDKEKAYILRRQGNSYKKIRTELGIPISTLADWFKNADWSTEIKNRLTAEESFSSPKKLELLILANRKRWKLLHEQYRREAIKEFSRLKTDPLFLAGIMLYWGEGEKQSKSSQVRLANSEPGMIKTFYLFLTKALKIESEKIFAWLLLYPDLVDPVQKNFWSKATGLPPDRFKKSIYIRGRHPTKRLSYGVCTVVVSSRALKERMLMWLELYQDYLHSHALSLEN